MNNPARLTGGSPAEIFVQPCETPQTGERIAELDGLRAVAVILVLLNHFAPTGAVPLLWRVAPVGWVGVDLFFVLSGYLITRILLATRNDGRYYGNFFVRRTLRIFPLYYCVLALIFAALLLDRHGVGCEELREWGSPLWFWLYLGNVHMALTGHNPPTFALMPLWSLHVEEQFYLLFPFIVRRVRRATLIKVLTAALLVSPVLRLLLWRAFPDNPLLQYKLLPCRFEGLALGGLIAAGNVAAWRLDGRLLGAIAAVGVSAGFMLLTAFGHGSYLDPFTRVIGYSLFPVMFAFVLLWALRCRGAWQTGWLRWAPMQFIGKRSYGMYLLQIPVSAALAAVLGSGTM